MWKIPSIETMKQQREVLTDSQFYQQDRESVGTLMITMILYIPPNKAVQPAFASSLSDDRHIPMQLQKPICKLGGHKSIVNSVVFHPHWPMVLTAGVERHIMLHSPTPDAPCFSNLAETPPDVRQLPSVDANGRRRALEALVLEPGVEESDDEGTIALFDE